ncbi:MAG: bifunctional nuclease family protein [Chloroflexota bacterium]|nr:bifunctional nuclease family protein [Chloroflexota bacterium]
MIEMEVASIRMGLMSTQRVVILKEKTGDRHLPIWIGIAEAESIMIGVQGGEMPRPLTHDLLRSVIDCLGARVKSIIVNDLRNDTFFANINLIVDGKAMDIDARPSDAIALAVRVEVPIYVEDSVLDAAGIVLSKGDDVDITEDELQKLAPFKDIIDTLNLDDLEKS